MSTPPPFRFLLAPAVLAACVLLFAETPATSGALLLTQVSESAGQLDSSTLDSTNPPSSRLLVHDKEPQVISTGLYAVSGASLSTDARTVFFAAKTKPGEDWQVFEQQVDGSARKQVTNLKGGAKQPCALADGIVFAAPGGSNKHQFIQLYRTQAGGGLQQLTFAPGNATDPYVLPDGRILFAFQPAAATTEHSAKPGLYTINNDGTEVSPFAGQHDGAAAITRPRLLNDGRLAFLVRGSDHRLHAEYVITSRPFLSRTPLFHGADIEIVSLEPSTSGELLVCAGQKGHFGFFRTQSSSCALGTPESVSPGWNTVAAIEIAPSTRPKNRISSMIPSKTTGQLLCLNANYSSARKGTNGPAVASVRLLAQTSPDALVPLGNVPVFADGSFLAEVPTDVPLGFEALSKDGEVIERVNPVVWLRPGENRSCIGCHEPHTRAPHNGRPLAVGAPIWKPAPVRLTQSKPGM